MHIVIDDLVIRLPIADLIRKVKYSAYHWYTEVGVVVGGVDEAFTDQAGITHIYAIVDSVRTEFPLMEDLIPVGTTYDDPGATAYDSDTETSIPVSVSGVADLSIKGIKVLRYDATSEAGIEADPVLRTVTVV